MSDVIEAVAESLAEMEAARDELARGRHYLDTTDAIRASPIELSAETLIGYPDYVMPRVPKNPRAKRKEYFWDPRDIHDLPLLLRRWARAVERGAEREFEKQRREEIESRDAADLAVNLRRAA